MRGVFGRMRLVGVALLAATFIAGALAGAAVDRVLSADPPQGVERSDERGRDRGRRGGDGDGDGDHRRSYVIERIEMSDAQREAIDGILEERSARMRATWREVEPRLDAITDSARVEIMQVLTPEQRAEYERKLKERRRSGEDRRR